MLTKSILTPLPAFFRLDVFPFLLGYLGSVSMYFSTVEEQGNEKWLLILPGLLLVQIFFFLLGTWSTSIYCFFTCRTVSIYIYIKKKTHNFFILKKAI